MNWNNFIEVAYQHPFATFFFILVIGWSVAGIVRALNPFKKDIIYNCDCKDCNCRTEENEE